MITIHDANATDFSTLGLGVLQPIECEVEETAGGRYELTLVQPITDDGRHLLIANHRIIRAPSPVREAPIDAGAPTPSVPETVSREIYEVDVNTRLRLRTGPSTSYKIIGRYKDGTQVIKLEENNGWYRVEVCSGGATGWMSAQYLDYVRTDTETIQPDNDLPGPSIQVTQARDQLYRIYSVERDATKRTVTAIARHITYDLAGVLVAGEYAPEGVAANAAVAQLLSLADHATDFTIYCNVTSPVTGEYTGRNLLDCLLGGDDGIVPQTGARVFRDNYNFYILEDVDRSPGVYIRYAKNLLEAALTEDVADIVTRILPIGKDADGNRLAGAYVDSARINDYPTIYAQEIEYDVKVGDGDDEYDTEDAAKAKLAELAQADMDSGIDLPTVSLDAEFVRLELMPEYAELANQYALHLYDSVPVRAANAGIAVTVRMTSYVWDALREKYTETGLGDITEMQSTVYGTDIAPGAVSGTHIAPGSVGETALRNLSVTYAKIAVAAIQHLSADAINATKAYIHEIAANEITTDQLYADFAKIMELAVGNITADNIETDELAAVLGDFIALYSDYAGIDFADVKDLIADEAIFRVGVANELYIDRLVATSAFLASATLGGLILRGEDGNYYKVYVQMDGTIRTELVELTDDEISAGEASDGSGIVDTDVDIPGMNGGNILGSSAVIAEILTDSLTAGKITAGQALIASAEIPELYTTAINAIGNSIDITANSTIQLLIANDEQLRAWLTFSENGMQIGKAGSTYSTLTDDTGFHIQQLGEKIGSFAKRRLITEAVQVGPVNASGMRVVMRSAYDGGVVFVSEVVS